MIGRIWILSLALPRGRSAPQAKHSFSFAILAMALEVHLVGHFQENQAFDSENRFYAVREVLRYLPMPNNDIIFPIRLLDRELLRAQH